MIALFRSLREKKRDKIDRIDCATRREDSFCGAAKQKQKDNKKPHNFVTRICYPRKVEQD